MDALRLLKRDHTRIVQLFDEFDALPERACVGRQAIVGEINELVRRHITVEEALLNRRAEHDREDYALMLRVLGEIGSMDCHEVTYVPRVLMLRSLLLRHIREEAV
jgi:hypothetical protein